MILICMYHAPNYLEKLTPETDSIFVQGKHSAQHPFDNTTYPVLCGHEHDKDQFRNGEQADDARPGKQGPAQPTDQAVDEDRRGHEHHEIQRAQGVCGEGQLAMGLQYPGDLAREGPQIDDLRGGGEWEEQEEKWKLAEIRRRKAKT